MHFLSCERSRWLVIAIAAALLLQPAASRSQTGDAEADFQTALDALENQAQQIESWSVEFTTTVKHRDHADDPFQKQVMRKSERRLGEKFRSEDNELNAPTPESRFNQIRTFDGNRRMTYDPPQERGGVASSAAEPSKFHQNFYGMLQPFPSVLKDGAPLRAPEWITRAGRRLLSVAIKHPKYSTEYEILLDPAHAWQPAEFVSTSFVDPGGTKQTSKWQESRYQYAKYHTEGEISIPTRVESTTDMVEPNGKRFRSSESVAEAASIQINPDLSEETFAIDFPEGTEVFDQVRNVKYVAGEPDSEERVRASVPAQAGADPAAGPWWSDYRLWIALSVVLIAGALWWKWREQH